MDKKQFVCFMHGDKLPTVYDVVINIFSICSESGNEKIKQCINIIPYLL